MARAPRTGTQVAVRLFGAPVIERDGQAVPVDTRKAIALLAYLAVARRPSGRDELAAMLWPDSDHVRARAALRRTLSALGTALGGAGLRTDGDAVSLDRDGLWVDIDEFRTLAARDDVDSLVQAVDLARGDFLAGFGLRDSESFDDWQRDASEQARREVGSALERLSEALAPTDVDAAISYARRWLALDPLQESAHRALMRLHAQKGDRAAAVRQYRDCVALLERELGVGPDESTTEIYEAAHGGPAAEVGQHAGTLHELVGDLLTLQGRYKEAKQSYEIASAAGAPAASVGGKLADVHQRLGDYEGAEVLYAQALEAIADGTGAALLLADRSLNAHRRGRVAEADEWSSGALREAEATGDVRALAQAHNTAGILASHRGDAAGAVTHLEASLKLAEQQNDQVATAAALNNLALSLRGSDIDRAVRLSQRALDLCARVGDRHREAAMHSNFADLLRDVGRNDEAMSHQRMSAAIFAEVGESDELHPEIWKLVEW
ncbi:MAG: BTAD domain-containing putative transcriptional regulator [Actinomycetota bacterium]